MEVRVGPWRKLSTEELMLLNCGAGQDSWESLGLQGDPTSPAAAAKSLQSCSTPCDPRDGSPPGSPFPGSLQARTLEWVAISFSNAWKWKFKVKSLSRVWLLATSWTLAYQAPPSMGFSSKSTGMGCHHCLLCQPVHPKGNQPQILIGRADAEAATPILWPPDGKNWLIWKDPDARKDWGRDEKGPTEWNG